MAQISLESEDLNTEENIDFPETERRDSRDSVAQDWDTDLEIEGGKNIRLE